VLLSNCIRHTSLCLTRQESASSSFRTKAFILDPPLHIFVSSLPLKTIEDDTLQMMLQERGLCLLDPPIAAPEDPDSLFKVLADQILYAHQANKKLRQRDFYLRVRRNLLAAMPKFYGNTQPMLFQLHWKETLAEHMRRVQQEGFASWPELELFCHFFQVKPYQVREVKSLLHGITFHRLMWRSAFPATTILSL